MSTTSGSLCPVEIVMMRLAPPGARRSGRKAFVAWQTPTTFVRNCHIAGSGFGEGGGGEEGAYGADDAVLEVSL